MNTNKLIFKINIIVRFVFFYQIWQVCLWNVENCWKLPQSCHQIIQTFVQSPSSRCIHKIRLFSRQIVAGQNRSFFSISVSVPTSATNFGRREIKFFSRQIKAGRIWSFCGIWVFIIDVFIIKNTGRRQLKFGLNKTVQIGWCWNGRHIWGSIGK